MRIYRSFGEFLHDLGMRLTGPMWFRFILQPMAAIVLGIRDGLKDAKAGRAPFLLDLIVRPEGRRRQMQRAVESLVKPIIVAVILDAIAQYLMLRTIYPGAAILVGTCVMGIPYALARSITNRVASARLQRAPGEQHVGI